MTFMTALFFICLGVFAYLAFSFAHIKTDNQRLALVVTFVTVVGVTYFTMIDLMGRPRPERFSILAEDYDLLGFTSDKKFIYLWVREPGAKEPLSLSLPFSADTARRIRKAINNDEGEGVMIKSPRMFRSSEADWQPHEPTYAESPPKTPE